jgi:hypothetical protein
MQTAHALRRVVPPVKKVLMILSDANVWKGKAVLWQIKILVY